MDRRKQRSMQIIWNSFFDLMTKENNYFSKITVNQICDKAMIHRSTIYKHFDDKFSLLEYGLHQLYESYIEISLKKRVLEPFKWAHVFFENSQAQQLALAQKKDELFFDFMKNFSIQMMKKDASKLIKYDKNVNIPEDLLVDFLVSSIFTLSESHDKKKDTVSLEQMDFYFKELVISKMIK
ncbi:TetR/AcrR family transcriptional regulator [Bacillus chungangensis]|uniref:AcrR family transcriptional regulator n=1 Tax=Bacillus chungangensis TaxID=587633 RepID=A0ABT9WNX9_9BACI|nr:TetR/AcrR family transcriptional regulator [Bacillus chungangensis]MDQ0174983.1 AcrR family transcriptional regulator [Bacillus chungangensis]